MQTMHPKWRANSPKYLLFIVIARSKFMKRRTMQAKLILAVKSNGQMQFVDVELLCAIFESDRNGFFSLVFLSQVVLLPTQSFTWIISRDNQIEFATHFKWIVRKMMMNYQMEFLFIALVEKLDLHRYTLNGNA